MVHGRVCAHAMGVGMCVLKCPHRRRRRSTRVVHRCPICVDRITRRLWGNNGVGRRSTQDRGMLVLMRQVLRTRPRSVVMI